MGILAIMFLVFGILATGATRQNIYSGAKCIMGGRISALFVSINVTTSTVYFEMYNKLNRFALLMSREQKISLNLNSFVSNLRLEKLKQKCSNKSSKATETCVNCNGNSV